jgi:diaminohydroxyphosphoribosylaminopyrimidine deaminase/5-amino-6-(5-phosphoribosylamino)uracil reductase
MALKDVHFRRALELARAGVGLVSPNPAVGAVVVDTAGDEVGAGTHTYDGVKHGEVLALEKAGKRAQGGTLYLNLEPCSHRGRTGPCSDVIITAGIARVVCSMEDPNPLVSGRGFQKLREAGIAVEVGGYGAEARKLNESFAKFIRTGNPFVTLKCAMTLDGKITRHHELSHAQNMPLEHEWITGEAARADVQRLRHEHDAIVVGVGTVIADDPLLTDRSGRPRRRKLLRVVLDSRLRIPLTSRVIENTENDVLVVYCDALEERKRELQATGIRVEQVPANTSGRVDFVELLRLLGKMEITSLLVEGGARVNGTALASRQVDRVFLYFAPKIFVDGVPFACGDRQEFDTLPDLLKSVKFHQFEDDFAVEGYLRDPYAE